MMPTSLSDRFGDGGGSKQEIQSTHRGSRKSSIEPASATRNREYLRCGCSSKKSTLNNVRTQESSFRRYCSLDSAANPKKRFSSRNSRRPKTGLRFFVQTYTDMSHAKPRMRRRNLRGEVSLLRVLSMSSRKVPMDRAKKPLPHGIHRHR